MKYILTIVLTLLTLAQAAAFPKGFYARRSVLSEGKWVKVTVDESGIYEVSYEMLRNMGFSDPTKVAVFGRGGAMMEESFVDAMSRPLISDDLSPVSVYHQGDKLYFYGQGTDTQTFRSASAYNAKGYFVRSSKNIYSDKGYYFLTDTATPQLVETSPSTSMSTLTNVAIGVGKVAHEADLVQNDTETGQLYFGEKVSGDTSRREWVLNLPGAIPNRLGTMECYFYLDREINGTLSYGVAGSDDFVSYETRTYPATNYRAQEPYLQEMNIPGENTTLFVSFDCDDDPDIAHIDYWTLTYQRHIPTLVDGNGNRIAQDYVCLPSVTRNKSVAVQFDNAGSMVVFDISNRTAPVNIELVKSGSSALGKVTNTGSVPELIVFNPMMPQKQIKSYDDGFGLIANQNLHAAVADGADLLIICVPSLKPEAERLAQIHRDAEGIKVVVATTEEVYNEFSQGVPDAMAYRSFVKAAYETSHPVKNLLLLGPLAADYRGIVTEKDPRENIIAYQTTPMNQVRGAQNANDFYGMMIDRIVDNNPIEKQVFEVGVGVLPCRFAAEANTIIDKIEEYLTRTDFAYFSNRVMNVGGIGDNHSHDSQALKIGSSINQLDSYSTILTPLVVDAYGFDGAHEKFFDAVEDGRIYINYFGHGATSQLNQTGNFFMINDVYKLRNSFLPFMSFAGCTISNSDRGVRGLGEALVTSTPYGLIGTFLATRETWSGQNLDLFEIMTRHMYRDGGNLNSLLYETPLTIGEIIARTKSESMYLNELAYQLICDPALKLPLMSREIVLEDNLLVSKPGEFNEIKGYVSNIDGSKAAGYNGEIVIRLMEPFRTLTSQDLCTGDDESTTLKLNVTYADTQVSMTHAEVVNGEFTARLFVPEITANYAGQIGRLHFCSYDPASKLIGGAMYQMQYSDKTGETTESSDVTPPVINAFEYRKDDNAIYVSVSDNVALRYSQQPLRQGLSLKIDGVDYATAVRHEAYVGNDGASFSKLVPLSDLPEGTHSAVLTVFDVAGNRAIGEMIFSYDPNSAKFALELVGGAVDGEGVFRSSGSVTPTSADIVILDANGMLVYRGDFGGEEFVWDGCDNGGEPVAPGHYKAYLIERGTGSGKGHSATIDVPVI